MPDKMSESQYIRIPPNRRRSLEIREALNRRIMAGIPVIEDDGWKYARIDKDAKELFRKKK